MTEYRETNGTDDLESRVLEAVTDGHPYVLVIVEKLDPDLDLQIITGGGIPDARTVKNLLDKAVKAFPS